MTDSKIARRRPDPCMHTPKMFAARLGLAVGASLCLWSSALGNDAGVARLQSPIDYWNGSVTLTETATMAVRSRFRRASDYETMPQAALSVDMHPKGIYALTVIDMGSTSVPLQPCHSMPFATTPSINTAHNISSKPQPHPFFFFFLPPSSSFIPTIFSCDHVHHPFIDRNSVITRFQLEGRNTNSREKGSVSGSSYCRPMQIAIGKLKMMR